MRHAAALKRRDAASKKIPARPDSSWKKNQSDQTSVNSKKDLYRFLQLITENCLLITSAPAVRLI